MDEKPLVPSTDRPVHRLSAGQTQTRDTFGYKWSLRDTYENPALKRSTQQWLFQRYCEGDDSKLDGWLSGGTKRILDIGCGSGFSALLFFGSRLKGHEYAGVDVSESVRVAEERFREEGLEGQFIQADLMNLPFPDDHFDMLFSEGVLHHTDNTGEAIARVSRKLKPGGLFLFYVYAKKAPMREFCDDWVREQLRDMSNDEAWEALKPLTLLGQELGELQAEVDLKEPIPLLGIPAGKINVQRLFYYYFCKAFFQPELGLEEMNHINFDWYRPLNCHRHTPEEVRQMCRAAGLVPEHFSVEPSGITVVARKRALHT